MKRLGVQMSMAGSKHRTGNSEGVQGVKVALEELKLFSEERSVSFKVGVTA